MSKVACYTVGREAAADVALPHRSVSRLHAEVIPLPDGRVYVTDCASTNGTFVHESGQWRRIAQDFAAADGRVRFGDVEMRVPLLLAETTRAAGAGRGTGASPADAPPAGKGGGRPADREPGLDVRHGVARNPETGEPIALGDDE